MDEHSPLSKLMKLMKKCFEEKPAREKDKRRAARIIAEVKNIREELSDGCMVQLADGSYNIRCLCRQEIHIEPTWPTHSCVSSLKTACDCEFAEEIKKRITNASSDK